MRDNITGRDMALDGHRVQCPQCGGEFIIIATGNNTHGGRRIAYLGDSTTCGATLQKAAT